jgi:ribosomal protein L12E/L44/L45/RPP1/RPP2
VCVLPSPFSAGSSSFLKRVKEEEGEGIGEEEEEEEGEEKEEEEEDRQYLSTRHRSPL